MLGKLLAIIDKFTRKEENTLEYRLEKVLSSLGISLRRGQNEMLSFLFQSTSKFKGVEAPTGTGKTVVYLIYSTVRQQDFDHIIISTYSKGLQEQIKSELRKFFNTDPLVLMGKSNYLCRDKMEYYNVSPDFVPKHLREKVKVSSHYCRSEYPCKFRGECEYISLVSSIDSQKFIIVNHFLLPYVLRKFSDKRILLIIDECHMLKGEKEIFVPEDVFSEIPEPKREEFKDIREYNIALEEYYRKRDLVNFVRKHNITSPGKYRFDSHILIDFDNVNEVIFGSATLNLPGNLLDKTDILTLKDARSWKNVKIVVKDTNYKEKNYQNILKSVIKDAMKKYQKVLILCTSYAQLEMIKNEFPEVVTTKEMHHFRMVASLKDGVIKYAAGTDVFWTGIDVPGEKAIIMTKLPFPSYEDKEEHNFLLGYQEMIFKLKQGIGRMLRSSECKGEIILLDNRVSKYPEVVSIFRELEKLGARVEFEFELGMDARNYLTVVK